MPLIGVLNNVLGGGYYNGNNSSNGVNSGNPATTPEETTQTGSATPPVEETSSSEEQTGAETSGGGVGTTAYANWMARQAFEAASTPAPSQTLRPVAEERDDTVHAVDFARRAAIAAQTRMQTESLLEGLVKDETFTPLSQLRQDADGAYARADAAPRPAEKTELRA